MHRILRLCARRRLQADYIVFADFAIRPDRMHFPSWRFTDLCLRYMLRGQDCTVLLICPVSLRNVRMPGTSYHYSLRKNVISVTRKGGPLSRL